MLLNNPCCNALLLLRWWADGEVKEIWNYRGRSWNEKKKEFTILVRVPGKKTFPPCSCHDFFFPVLFENPHRTRKGKKDAKRLNVRESWRTLSHIPDVKKGQKFKLAACLCHKPRVRVPREKEGKKKTSQNASTYAEVNYISLFKGGSSMFEYS